MDAERWRRVDALFARLMDAAAADRESALAGEDPEVRAEVESLLACDAPAAKEIGERVAAGVQLVTGGPVAARRAGPYVLSEELGRGGMGTVYRGERDDGQYHGAVAVKLLRPGFETGMFLDRFARERQALARLVHPNIARLLDSGNADDGTPYIVMELVEGQPILEYCRSRQLGVERILELFLPVCRAVAHAHQRLIVHRDLKPGNILVTADGVPKLLDFGICKTLDDTGSAVTATIAQMLTPDYASPEQVRGETITPASDIYSLGAVLYHLLTGHGPHRIERYTAPEIARAVCDTATMRPGISDDVDTILLEALHKDPNRRYASAERFAEDLRRVLANEPVLARPDTLGYRAGKFVRRHRWSVAAAAAVAVGLAGGLVAYARQAAIAREEAAEARRVANAVLFDIHDAVRDLPGSLRARQRIIQLGLTYLDRLRPRAASDEALRRELASAYLRLGEVQADASGSNTGDVAGGLKSFDTGLAVLGDPGTDAEALAAYLRLIGHVADITASRDQAAAIAWVEKGLPAAERVSADPSPSIVALRGALFFESKASMVLRRSARMAEASDAAKRASALGRKLLAALPGDHEARMELAAALVQEAAAAPPSERAHSREAFLEAIQLYENEQRERPRVETQRSLMFAYAHLGDVLGNPSVANLGDPAAASKAFDTMLAHARELHEKNPDDHASLRDYGMALGRVAMLPLRGAADRLMLFDRSKAKLAEALAKDPSNVMLRLNIANHERFAGPVAEAAGLDPLTRYRNGLAVLTPDSFGNPSARGVAIDLCKRLALDAARRGNGQAARAHAAEALKIVAPFEGREKTLVEKVARHRAHATMGLVLRESGAPDWRPWVERALEGHRSIEKARDFSYGAELREWEALLGKSETR